MDPIRIDNWGKGSNNKARPNRLPAGFVRRLMNLDASPEGLLNLRPGYEKVHAGGTLRGAWGVGQYVVMADGLQLLSFDTRTNSTAVLGDLQSEAPLAGVVLNSTLYLSSLTGSLRTDGRELSPWEVRAPGFLATTIDGALPAGIYKVAAVAAGADGEESGCEPQIVSLPVGGGIRLTTSDPRPLRVYASVANGATLFYQGLLIDGALALTLVDDKRERLVTGGLVSLPACTQLAAHHSVIVGCDRSYVFFTTPMMPHLMDPVRGFLQYGAPVDVVAATDGGVYIAADKTYFVTALESSRPQQREVLSFGAVPGSTISLPNGAVAWFTEYGLAIGYPDGRVDLPNRDTFAPDVAYRGAGGLVNYDGKQLAVTTMRGVTSPNNLMTGDFADLETGND